MRVALQQPKLAGFGQNKVMQLTSILFALFSSAPQRSIWESGQFVQITPAASERSRKKSPHPLSRDAVCHGEAKAQGGLRLTSAA